MEPERAGKLSLSRLFRWKGVSASFLFFIYFIAIILISLCVLAAPPHSAHFTLSVSLCGSFFEFSNKNIRDPFKRTITYHGLFILYHHRRLRTAIKARHLLFKGNVVFCILSSLCAACLPDTHLKCWGKLITAGTRNKNSAGGGVARASSMQIRKITRTIRVPQCFMLHQYGYLKLSVRFCLCIDLNLSPRHFF